MLRLKESVDVTKRIQPLCLPDSFPLNEETFLGIKCVAIGWGMKSKGSSLENKLQQVVLPVIDNYHCSKMYAMMHNIDVKHYHLCAGYTQGKSHATCIVSDSLCIL